jgi:hypothetical protein
MSIDDDKRTAASYGLGNHHSGASDDDLREMRRFTVGSITDKERRTGKRSRRKRGAP